MKLELKADNEIIFRADIKSRPENEQEMIELLKEILSLLESKSIEDINLF